MLLLLLFYVGEERFMLKSKMLTKTICVCLIAVLLGTACVGACLASSYPSGDFIPTDVLPDSLIPYFEDAIANDSDSDVFICHVDGYVALYFIPSTCEVCISSQTGKLGFSEVADIYGWYVYTGTSNPPVVALTSQLPSNSQGTFTEFGEVYYCTSWDRFSTKDFTCFSSNGMIYGGSYVEPNLTVRDTRFLEVVPQTLYNADYLVVTADTDVFAHVSSLTVYYTDTTGSKFYVFESYQYLNSFYDNPYSSFKVNVSNIPTVGAFTLTSAELYTDGAWGSKSVSFSYSYTGSDVGLPSSYTDITYFNNFFESEHLSSIGSAFIGTLYFGVYSDTNTYYLRDNNGYLVENFDVKYIALPNFLWDVTGSDSANWDFEEYYELFEMFDVVILGLGETAFDEIYGSGSYYTLNAGWNTGTWGVSAIINRIEKYTPVYHSTLQSLFESNPNDFVWSAYANDIGFIVTRNYLLKKVFYSLGDVDSRLLDFESKLLSENGVLSSIEEKMILGLSQNNSGWNIAIDGIGRLNAFFDNLLVSGWLDKVTGSLEDIKSLLSTSADDFGTLLGPFKAIYDFFKGGLDTGLLWMDDFIGIGQKAFSEEVPLLPTLSPTIPLIPTISIGG